MAHVDVVRREAPAPIILIPADDEGRVGRDGDIEVAVAIEIAHRERVRRREIGVDHVLRPCRPLEPVHALAVAAGAHHVDAAVAVDVPRLDVRRALFLGDPVFRPRLAGGAALPPRERPAARVAEQDVPSPIAIEVGKVEIVWPAVGAGRRDDLAVRPARCGEIEPRQAVGKRGTADAVGNHVGAAVSVDVGGVQAVDAVEFPVDDVHRPRRTCTPGILDPRHAEVGAGRLRERLPLGLGGAVLDPRNLIAADGEIGGAVAVRIERDAIQHLPLLGIEERLRRPLRRGEGEDFGHPHRHQVALTVRIHVERRDTPDRFGQRKRTAFPSDGLRRRRRRFRLCGRRAAFKPGRREIQCVDHAFVAHDVEVPRPVRRKRCDAFGRQRDLPQAREPAALLREPPDATRRKIAEHIDAVKRRGRVAAIDVAARDRVAVAPFVGGHRRNVDRTILPPPIRKRLEAFIHVPSVILAAPHD